MGSPEIAGVEDRKNESAEAAALRECLAIIRDLQTRFGRVVTYEAAMGLAAARDATIEQLRRVEVGDRLRAQQDRKL